jgi:hypothetical protein
MGLLLKGVIEMLAYLGVFAFVSGLPAAQAASPNPSELKETRVVYKCTEKSSAVPSRYEGLLLSKNFLEDGTVDFFTVEWRGKKEGLISVDRPDDRVDLWISWPGNPNGGIVLSYGYDSGPFVLENSTVFFHQYSNLSIQRTPDERWSQTVITRKQRQGIYGGNGSDRFDRIDIFSSDNSGISLESNYATFNWELKGLSQPVVSRFPIASLAAWGSGATQLFAMDVRATPIKGKNLNKFNPPIIRKRVISSYAIGMKQLNEVMAFVKEAVPQWEAEVSDFRERCTREVEEDPYIIVTDYRHKDDGVAEPVTTKAAAIDAGESVSADDMHGVGA